MAFFKVYSLDAALIPKLYNERTTAPHAASADTETIKANIENDLATRKEVSTTFWSFKAASMGCCRKCRKRTHADKVFADG